MGGFGRGDAVLDSEGASGGAGLSGGSPEPSGDGSGDWGMNSGGSGVS